MRLLKNFSSLFKKKEHSLSEEDRRWAEGHDFFIKGKQFFQDYHNTETKEPDLKNALYCFDKAIEYGYQENTGDLFGLRGGCLQHFDFHLEAIEDFDKAIYLAPQDCNLYYQRSISKRAVADLQGCVSDSQEAVRLLKLDDSRNKAYNEGAKSMGLGSITGFYNSNLEMAIEDINSSDYIKELITKRAKLQRRTVANTDEKIMHMD